MRKRIAEYWYGKKASTRYMSHVIVITGLVFLMIYLGSSFKINIKSINPLTRSLTDYEITDIVFSKFRDPSTVDLNDEIIIVNTGRPDRENIVNALKRLEKFNVKAIGIDILFNEYDSSAIDEALAVQAASMPNLVLASILGDYNSETGLFEPMHGCANEISETTATGYINFVARPEHSIRLFSTNEYTEEGQQLAFAVKILQKAYPQKVAQILQNHNSLERINYKGNQGSFLFYELDQLMSDQEGLAEVFDDKIIIMGYAGEGEENLSSRDKFYTPMNDKIAAKSMPDMYGLVIHANILGMLMEGSWITELPKWCNRILEILIVMLSVAIFRMDFISFRQVFWLLIRILQIVMFILLFYLVVGVFYFFDVRLNLNIGIIGALIAWDVVDLYENIILPRLKKLCLGTFDETVLSTTTPVGSIPLNNNIE